MAFLTQAELNTHMFTEVSTEISRGDATILDQAITSAIEETRGYLVPRYDDVATFGATGDARNPILLMFVKDIATWHFINLCNVNMDFQVRKDRYDRSIKWLREVQAGITNPTLPVPSPDVNGFNPNSGVQWLSNPKRNNNPSNF